jgi:hypothetical protein
MRPSSAQVSARFRDGSAEKQNTGVCSPCRKQNETAAADFEPHWVSTTFTLTFSNLILTNLHRKPGAIAQRREKRPCLSNVAGTVQQRACETCLPAHACIRHEIQRPHPTLDKDGLQKKRRRLLPSTICPNAIQTAQIFLPFFRQISARETLKNSFSAILSMNDSFGNAHRDVNDALHSFRARRGGRKDGQAPHCL